MLRQSDRIVPPAVLVVDDVDINRRLTSRMVESFGCRVQAVEGGAQALDAVERGTFDVVLMDVSMPGMDGCETTRRMRALAGGARLAIVALSAADTAEDRARCLAAGMDGHLAKGFMPEALCDAIDGALRARSIDWSRIESLKPYDADGSMVREALDAFLRAAPQYLDAMRAASEACDAQGLAAAAHALRGAAANVGARRLESGCRDAERLALAHGAADSARTVLTCTLLLEEARLALKPPAIK